MLFTLAAIIVGAGLSSAQTISSGCQTTLINVVSSPNAQCLNPSALISLATASANSSVIGPVNTWLQGLCSQPACSNSSLAELVTNVTSGCSTELSDLGIGTSDTALLITEVQQVYPTVRKVVCLQDNSVNQLCVTELLTDIQSAVGTLSINNIVQIIPNILSGSAQIPQTVTCSKCVKEAYNIVNADFPGSLSGVSSTLSSLCGASFIDGAAPPTISETATTATAANNAKTGGATSLLSVNFVVAVAASTLVIVSSAFAVLA